MTPTLPAGSRMCRESRPTRAALLTRPSGRSRLLRNDPSTISSPARAAADPDKPGRPRSDRQPQPHNHSPPALTRAQVQISSTSSVESATRAVHPDAVGVILLLMERNRRLRLEWELERRTQEFVIVALVPRSAKALRPSAFLGPRGVIAVVAIKTLLYESGSWLGPRLQRWALRVERERTAAVEHLKADLGRQPADHELYREMGSARRARRDRPGRVRRRSSD
jgi:hypothetical protein